MMMIIKSCYILNVLSPCKYVNIAPTDFYFNYIRAVDKEAIME